jgi:hypothetical protein
MAYIHTQNPCTYLYSRLEHYFSQNENSNGNVPCLHWSDSRFSYNSTVAPTPSSCAATASHHGKYHHTRIRMFMQHAARSFPASYWCVCNNDIDSLPDSCPSPLRGPHGQPKTFGRESFIKLQNTKEGRLACGMSTVCATRSRLLRRIRHLQRSNRVVIRISVGKQASVDRLASA